MDGTIQKLIILGSLGGTAYIVATCPCASVGYCKKELFLGLSIIPLTFAVFNFVGGATCSKAK
jgi:hypothetical protein